MSEFIDLYQDTWAACDDLNRELPLNVNVSDKNRKVGIFYFMWHEGAGGELMDHTLAYAIGGIEEFERVLVSGRRGFGHYWAQPYFGYYRSDDEWVIRKHAYMLADSGIDFIFLDITNGLIYRPVCETILKVWDEIRKEGYKTPEVMFISGNTPEVSRRSVTDIWDAIFSKGLYKDLWFYWQGKPLMLAPQCVVETLTQEQQDFFTFRASWANTDDEWYAATDGNGAWPWADMYPQKPGKSETGEIEQAIVMCGFWVNGSYGTNAGRSYCKGKQPDNETDRDYGFSHVNKTSPLGLAFEEQFEHALGIDPPVVMITGWNEWWAGRWDNTLPGGGNPAQGQLIANTYIVEASDPKRCNYFVDNLNGEYSRDIEPVKGLYNDNYYYQMVSNIRKYKGTRRVPTAYGQKTIDIYGSAQQWNDVGPEYLDYEGDTKERNADSYVGGFHYVNTTGRNDLMSMKVSADDEYVYFYARCASDITAPEGTNWMNLFINSDRRYDNGWHGFDFVINRTRDKGLASVEAFIGGWTTIKVGDAEYNVTGNTIQIKVSRKLIKVDGSFEFKWADNSVDDGDIMEFMDKGDCAPNMRFNYIYTL
ncbi:MAG: hypothetical protein E7385_03340 [Ruminococcaceae bacterium]|nr:hypothetical protein [Oscillospiraceae bacterium]